MLLVIVGSPSSGRKTALNWLEENLKYEMVDSSTISTDGQQWLAKRLVATVASTGGEAESLLQMPLAFALAIDAPCATRWERARQQQPDVTLQQFISLSDEVMYGSAKVGSSTSERLPEYETLPHAIEPGRLQSPGHADQGA